MKTRFRNIGTPEVPAFVTLNYNVRVTQLEPGRWEVKPRGDIAARLGVETSVVTTKEAALERARQIEEKRIAADRAKRKASASKNVETGECQICGRRLKVVRGKISLHGYDRPGTGVIHGQCFGAQRLPYEVSHDAIDEFIDLLRKRRTHTEENLAYVTNPDLKEITDYKIERGGRPGPPVTYKRGERDARGYDMFGITVDGRARGYEQEIKALDREIERLEKRRVAWRPKA